MLRGIGHPVITRIAAFVEGHASLWITNQVVFALLQMERIDRKLGINISGVEQKRMGRDSEQRLGVFPDTLDGEVFQILQGLTVDPIYNLTGNSVGDKIPYKPVTPLLLFN